MKKLIIFYSILILLILFFLIGCKKDSPSSPSVPHEGSWGIYALKLSTQNIALIHSSDTEISGIHLNHTGSRLVFSKKISNNNESFEIFTISMDGNDLIQLTNNSHWDTYPSFSPDGSKIAFLSMRNGTFDIYTMNINGSNQQELYDSSGHEGDVNWGSGNQIAYTQDFQIWSIKDDGTDPAQITDPPNAGIWGIANLPYGDYDPRYSFDGNKIAFERMVDVSCTYGCYDIFLINPDGSTETRLTHTGYAQGFANWSHSGDKIIFVVAAIGNDGKYDIYMMNADGSNQQNITPSYFPQEFLCHQAIFSKDDSTVYFIGQWWSNS